jgi:Fe-S oxidoreductase
MTGQSATAAPARGDAEYSEYVDHTTGCGACKQAGEPCPNAIQLGRAWRKARR